MRKQDGQETAMERTPEQKLCLLIIASARRACFRAIVTFRRIRPLRAVDTSLDRKGSIECCPCKVICARTPRSAIPYRGYSGGSPSVAMMKTADLRQFHHSTSS